MRKTTPPLVIPESEQNKLKEIVSQGKHSAREINRAQILLHSSRGERAEAIAQWQGTSLATVYNVRKEYVSGGLANALYEKPRPGQPRKLDLRQESEITVLACSTAPEGHARWTVRLLADRIVKLEIVDQIAPETVRQFLKKTNLNLG